MDETHGSISSIFFFDSNDFCSYVLFESVGFLCNDKSSCSFVIGFSDRQILFHLGTNLILAFFVSMFVQLDRLTLSIAIRFWMAKTPQQRAKVDLDTHYSQVERSSFDVLNFL